MTGSGALAAGWLLVISTAVFAGLGAFVGGTVDARFLGGLAGGVLGTVLGFILVWRLFVVPANEEVRNKDYSAIPRLEDDDEDSW